MRKKRSFFVPAVRDGNDSGSVLGDLEKHWHGKVEVRTGRVAPAAIVTWKSVVRRAKVCGCYENRRTPGMAPLRIVSALKLEAGSAAQTVVEQSSA